MHPHMYNLLTGGARICYAPPDGNASGSAGNNASGGNPPLQQTDNNNQGGGNQNADDENSSGDFDLTRGNIWEQPQEPENRNGNGGGNNGQGNGEGNNSPDVMSQFDKFIEGKNFDFSMSPEDIQKFVASGDAAGLQAAMLKSQRTMYKQVMLDASTMVNAAVRRAVDAAVSKATGNFEVSNARTTLQRMVPLAKNPNIAPVAEAVMSTFTKKGMGHEEAAGKVGQFLNALRNVKGKDIGVDDPPRQLNNNRGSRAAIGDDDEDIDWLSFAKST